MRAAVQAAVPDAVPDAVRPAVASDVDQLLAIKSRLALRPERREAPVGATLRAGGFLLGTSREAYADYIELGCVLVAERGSAVVAFSVVLSDAVLRSAPVYAKRGEAGIAPALLERLEHARVAYFDQLAAQPGHGAAAPGLAYRHLLTALATHDAVLATTVVEPVENLAAVPLLRAVGFVPVGVIDEAYPEAGRIRSRVYLAERAAVDAVRATRRAARFERRIGDLTAA